MIGFYVTAVRSPRRVAWLAGPFETKEAAEQIVPAARVVAGILDPWTDFDAFGVTRLESARLPTGRLHALVGF